VIFDALVVGFVRSNALRALVSIVALAFGVATALALVLTSAQSVRSLDSDRELFSQHVDFQVLPFGAGVSQSLLSRVRYLDGVASAQPIVDRPIAIGVDASGAGGDVARLVGVDLVQPLPGVFGFEEQRPGPFAPAGSFIAPAEILGTNGAIVPSAMATRRGLRRGDSFRILSGARIAVLRVANIIPPTATGIDSSVVFVDVGTAQTLLHEPGRFDRIDIVSAPTAAALRPALVAAIGTRALVVAPAASGFSLGALTGGIESTFGALTAIGLAVGGLLVFNTVATSIAHRRTDIGTLRALGVAPLSIAATFVTEGAAYGALGGFLGAAVAEVAVQRLAAMAGSQQAVAAYDVWTVPAAVLLGVIVAVASSIAPALSAAWMPPALAIRQGSFEGPDLGRERSLPRIALGAAAFGVGIAVGSHPSRATWFVFGFPLCFAAGIVLFIGPLWKALANVVRRATAGAPPSLRFAGLTLSAIPKRIAIAQAALAVAVFAAVAFDVASSSFATALHAWASDAIAGDLLVSPFGRGGTFDATVAARVRATPGVGAVIAVRTIQTQIGSTGVALRGEDAPVPRVMMTEPPATLGAPLAAALHVRVGDSVALRSPRGDLRLRVTAVKPDFSDARGSIVVARRVLRASFGDDRIDAFRVTIARDADVTSVENAIARRLAPQRIVTVTTRELRDRFTDAFDGTFAFVRGLAILIVTIASLGVASTLSALVFERRSELVMLRTIGASPRTIVRMLGIEASIIALAGSTIGGAIGVAFAAAQLYLTDPVSIGFAIPMTIPAASIAAVLCAAVAASIVGPFVSAPAAFRIATDGRR
jgi:putative ABC transport system permease protein